MWNLRLRDKIGAVPADKLRPYDLQTIYNDLRLAGGRPDKDGKPTPLAGKTVREVHGFVHAVLAWALRMELVSRNIADAVEAPKVTRRKAGSLTPDDAAAMLLAGKDSRFGPCATFVFATGLRRGELAALKWEQIDFAARTMTVMASTVYVPGRTVRKEVKTNRERTIPLSPLALAALKSQKAMQAAEKLRLGEAYTESGFVFTQIHGLPYKPNAIYRGYAAIAKKAGIALTKLHGARHTASSIMLGAGIDPTTVASILGHEQVSTTLDIYGHAIEGHKRKAVDAIDESLARPS
jgi:integrase